MQELLTPPRLGALESNAPRQLSTEFPWAKNTKKKKSAIIHTHKSALHVWNVYAYSQLPTNIRPLALQTHTHTYIKCALCTDRKKMRGPLNTVQETEVMNSVCGASEPGS